MIRRVATRMSTDQNVKHASAAQKVERQKQEKLQTWAFAKLSHANPITATDSLVDYVSHAHILLCIIQLCPCATGISVAAACLHKLYSLLLYVYQLIQPKPQLLCQSTTTWRAKSMHLSLQLLHLHKMYWQCLL